MTPKEAEGVPRPRKRHRRPRRQEEEEGMSLIPSASAAGRGAGNGAATGTDATTAAAVTGTGTEDEAAVAGPMTPNGANPRPAARRGREGMEVGADRRHAIRRGSAPRRPLEQVEGRLRLIRLRSWIGRSRWRNSWHWSGGRRRVAPRLEGAAPRPAVESPPIGVTETGTANGAAGPRGMVGPAETNIIASGGIGIGTVGTTTAAGGPRGVMAGWEGAGIIVAIGTATGTGKGAAGGTIVGEKSERTAARIGSGMEETATIATEAAIGKSNNNLLPETPMIRERRRRVMMSRKNIAPVAVGKT